MNELINCRYKEIPKDLVDDNGKFDKKMCLNFPHKCLDSKKNVSKFVSFSDRKKWWL